MIKRRRESHFWGDVCSIPASIRHCASTRTEIHSAFFFYVDHLTNDRVPGAIFKFPRLAPYWAPPERAFSGWHRLAEKSQLRGDLFFPKGTFGPLLSDHLVTIGVRINLWGPILTVVWCESEFWPKQSEIMSLLGDFMMLDDEERSQNWS